MDPNATGSFFCFNRQHDRKDIARSIIEGIIFNLYDAATGLFSSVGLPVEIRVTGGFMQTDFIRQITADIFNCQTIVMKNKQSGSFGAMFLARIALGWSKEITEINNWTQEDKVYFPNAKNVAVYQDLMPIYCDIGKQLSGTYQAIAAFKE